MKQKTAQEMRPLLDSYAQYEGSKKAFCLEQGIAEHTLDYWRRKLARPQPAPSAFIALEVDGMSRSGSIELYYPNGLRAVVPMGAPGSVWQQLFKLGS